MNYTLSVPNITNYRVKYYFSHKPVIERAHSFPPHIHDELEVYILLEGDASFIVNNNIYKLTSGDVVISCPNEIHNCILNTNSVHKQLCFWFDPSCEYVFEKFLNLKGEHPHLISPIDEEKAALLSLYTRLEKASENSNSLQQFYLQLNILDILGNNLNNKLSTTTIPQVLQDILDDVANSFTEINCLEFFIEKYQLSQSKLNRIFKKYLNTTPKAYLETKRLAYSRTLLKEEGKSVFDACMQSGFTDYSNYIRSFKKRFGITPNQYKNK